MSPAPSSKKEKLTNEEIKNDLETYIHGFDLDEEAIQKLQAALKGKTSLTIDEQLDFYSFLANLQEQTGKYQEAQKDLCMT